MHKIADLPRPPSIAALAALGPVSLFLDFDGTLVDIAATPNAIVVPTLLTDQLRALSDRLGGRLAIVSGRSLTDLDRHLPGLAVPMVGSHGAEFGGTLPHQPAIDGVTEIARSQVAAFVADYPKLLVETKPHGIAIHYRQEPDAAETVLSFMDELAERENLAVGRGKMVVEIGPLGASKGAAVGWLLTCPPFKNTLPVFLGDDITDEGAFAAVGFNGHGILVGAPRPTAAHYRLSSPQQVHEWLIL